MRFQFNNSFFTINSPKRMLTLKRFVCTSAVAVLSVLFLDVRSTWNGCMFYIVHKISKIFIDDLASANDLRQRYNERHPCSCWWTFINLLKSWCSGKLIIQHRPVFGRMPKTDVEYQIKIRKAYHKPLMHSIWVLKLSSLNGNSFNWHLSEPLPNRDLNIIMRLEFLLTKFLRYQ